MRWLCCLLPLAAWWLHRTLNVDGLPGVPGGKTAPTVWVAVLSRPGEATTRGQIREMWQAMPCGSAKFVLCQRGVDEEVLATVQREAAVFGDLLLLDCEEGYGRGLLVKKVLAALNTFVLQTKQPKLFMKVDDDSFVAWSLLCPKITSLDPPWGFVYMGMPDMVNRTDWWFNNTESPNYDPWENWPYNFYPFHMAGGPGYIIGHDLVEAILKLMGSPMSWNEDKAIGIGVFRAKNKGLPVRHIYLHMDDGETDTGKPFTGDWSNYPFYAQHQLSATSIECLFQLELNKSGSVDRCYRSTPWLRELDENSADG